MNQMDRGPMPTCCEVVLWVSFVIKQKRMISHQSLDNAGRLDGCLELKRGGGGGTDVACLHVIVNVTEIYHRRRTISPRLQERHLATTKERCAFSALTLLVGCQEEHPACKSWVMRCWCGYLSEARCRLFVYGPADATASQNSIISCLIKSRLVLPFRYWPTQVVLEEAVKRV